MKTCPLLKIVYHWTCIKNVIVIGWQTMKYFYLWKDPLHSLIKFNFLYQGCFHIMIEIDPEKWILLMNAMGLFTRQGLAISYLNTIPWQKSLSKSFQHWWQQQILIRELISLWNFIKAEIQCARRCILAPPSLPPPNTRITHIICLCVCTCIHSSTSLVKRFLISDQLIDQDFLF